MLVQKFVHALPLATVCSVALFTFTARAATFKSADESVQITLPDTWKDERTPPGQDIIQLIEVNEKLNAIITVTVEDTTDKVIALDDYMSVYLDRVKEKNADLTHTDPKPLKINGKDALRCELKHTQGGQKVGTVVTLLKIDTHFEMVAGTTTIDNFLRLKAALGSAAEKLSDIPPPKIPDVVCTGKDGTLQITLPGTWKQQPLQPNSEAELQLEADNFKQESQIFVVAVSRADTTETLKERLASHLAGLALQYPGLTHSEPDKLKAGTFEALRSLANIDSQGRKYVAILTVVQTPTQYYHVMVFCQASKFARYRNSLMKLADGVKELAGKSPAAGAVAVGKPVVVKSKDGTLQMSVPRSWKAAEPQGAAADLKLALDNQAQGCNLQIIASSRDKVKSTLAKLTAQSVKSYGKLPDASTNDPESIKINGQDATQFEVHATEGGTNIAYVITIIQTDKFFYQTIFTTTDSKLAKLKPTVNGLLETLKEVKPGDDE